jgi:hypothetical protein
MGEHGRKLGKRDAELLSANGSMTGQDHLCASFDPFDGGSKDRSTAQKAQDRQNTLY